jgi:hypothetical protein
MLSIALFTLSFLGFEQERTYALYGRERWKEVVFYTHLTSLPFCLPLAGDILARARAWMEPESYWPFRVPFFGGGEGVVVHVSLFVLLALNLLTQSVLLSVTHCDAFARDSFNQCDF